MLASEESILVAQNNLAITYDHLGRYEEALSLRQEVYSGRLKLLGEEHVETIRAAYNNATSLTCLERFEEARALLRKTMPVARRVLGESRELTLCLRQTYAQTIYHDPGATLDDLREAVTMLEDLERTMRRVLGGAHPEVVGMEASLQYARATLRARESPPGSA